MNKLKDIMGNKKLMVSLVGGFIGFIVLIVVLILVIKLINSKVAYSDMEDRIITATEKYLKEHDVMYPTEENPILTLSGTDLVEGKYIKDINKSLKEDCDTTIEVHYVDGTYTIKPFLVCPNYETKLFFDKILSDNPVTIEGDGLYDLNEMLVFRGDKPNNYLSFAGLTWRIVKMNPDGTIFVTLEHLKDAPLNVWDDRYNTNEESNHGVNDYTVSRAIDFASNFYRDKLEKYKSKILPMPICLGKRSETDNVNDGSLECSYIMEEEKNISLLPLYDYINASNDRRCTSAEDRACQNYNYLVTKVGKWWTLTGDGAKSTNVYGVNYTGAIVSDKADTKKYLRFVIALDGTNIYGKGNGTKDSPYVMK